MVGVLITSHGDLGGELIKAVELIKGPMQNVLHLSMDQTKGVETLKKEIASAIKKLDQGEGVLRKTHKIPPRMCL